MKRFELTWETKQSGLAGHWTQNKQQYTYVVDVVHMFELLSYQESSVRNINLKTVTV